MRALFKPIFKKDFEALEPEVRRRVEIFSSKIVPEIKNLRELIPYDIKWVIGKKNFYRIRIGDYRIGLKVENEDVIFIRVLHRKDVYRHFP